MMKKGLLNLVAATIFIFGLVAQSPAQQVVLKYGHVAPPLQIQGRASTFFKNYVEERAKGTLKIEIYPLGQLGGQRAMMDAVLAGTLDMTNAGAPILATVIPEFNALCLPFVIMNEDVFWDIIRDKDFRAKIFSLVRNKGAEPLGFSDACGRGLLNKIRPIRRPEDVKGLNIRVMEGPIYTDMFRAMGANTRTIPFPEVYTALQQGVVDGEDNALDMAVFMKFTEIEKHFTNMNQTIQTNPLIVSKPAWSKLNDAQKKLFQEAGEAMERYTQAEYRKDKLEGYKVAREKYGVAVIEDLTPEERAAFRKAVQPILPKYQKTIRDDVFTLYTSLAQKFEQKYKK